jgi:hypothetical protein
MSAPYIGSFFSSQKLVTAIQGDGTSQARMLDVSESVMNNVRPSAANAQLVIVRPAHDMIR